MAFTFEWDPQKAIANRRKHGITFDEATTVFGDPFGLVVEIPGTRSVSPDWSYWVTLRPTISLRSCSPSAVTAYVSSAPGQRLVANVKPMKKTRVRRAPRIDPDEILPEYDFSRGRRNPYAARMAGGHIVVLEPDVAEVFPNASAVNEALRALAGIIRDHRGRRPRTRTGRRRSTKGSA
jgi:hypothetical protein